MKLTQKKLKQIIREELRRTLSEQPVNYVPVRGHREYEQAITDYVEHFKSGKPGFVRQVLDTVVEAYEDAINKCEPQGDPACLDKAGGDAVKLLQHYRENTNVLSGPVNNEPWPVTAEHIFAGGSAERDPGGRSQRF